MDSDSERAERRRRSPSDRSGRQGKDPERAPGRDRDAEPTASAADAASAEPFRYGLLEARPDADEAETLQSEGPHFHYQLEFCHTHPGSHDKKAPNWRQEHVIDLGGGPTARHGSLPPDFESFLDERTRFGIKVGLENIRSLLTRLHLDRGLPPVVIVGGTNGKGTVAHALGEALSVAGYRPGVYTSPHVEHFLERIQVSNADPDEEAVEGACSAVRRAVEELDAEGVHPTYFEVGTALALEVFRRQRASPLVLEVGMGGRGDAVNAVTAMATVITNVGSDHAEHLGSTLADRVREKAGILRPGIPCFTAAQGEALRLLEDEAIRVGAPLVPVLPRTPPVPAEEALLALTRSALEDRRIVSRMPRLRDLDTTSVRLPRLPGRQEPFRLPGDRAVLLDVAHNAEALDTLAATLDGLPVPPEARVLLVGLLRDKPVEAVARLAAGRFQEVHVTRPLGERARPAAELQEALEAQGLRVAAGDDDPVAAFEAACGRVPEHGLLVVAGSFYLAAAVRPLLRRSAPRG